MPTNADDVFFDGSSGSGTVTIITANAICHSFNTTGFTGTLASSGTRTFTVGGVTGDTSAAVLTLGSGMTWSGGGTLTLLCDNRSGGLTVTTNGVTMSGITTLNTDANVAASVATTFADNINIGSATFQMRRGGAVISSGVTVTTTGTAQMTGTAGTTTFTYTNATLSCGSFSNTASNTTTISGTGGSITVTGLNATFAGNGDSYGGATINGTYARSITGANTFTSLTLTSSAQPYDLVSLAANQTITSAFVCTGNSQVNRLLVCSDTLGTARTLTVTGATVNGQTDVIFRDITASGATVSGTRVGDGGGNSGITMTGAVDRYFVASANTGSWSQNKWSTSSGGSTGASYPLPQDTLKFDDNTFFSGNNLQFDFDAPHIGIIDASGASAHTLTLRSAVSNSVFNDGTILYGNVTLSAQTVVSPAGIANNIMTTMGRGTQTWTNNGATTSISSNTNFIIKCFGGTFQPQDDWSWDTTNSTSYVVLQHGTFNPLGNVAVGGLTDSGTATKAFVGTDNKTLTLKGNSGSVLSLLSSGTTITYNNMTIAITDTGAGTKSAAFGTYTTGYVDITASGSGVVDIQNGAFLGTTTFKGIRRSGLGTKTVTFNEIITQNYSFSTNAFFSPLANDTNVWTVRSGSAGTLATINSSGSPINTDYVAIKDLFASIGRPHFAGAHSTNNGNNPGWNFVSYVGATSPTLASVNPTIPKDLLKPLGSTKRSGSGAAPAAETLTDNFDDNSLDSSKWTTPVSSPGTATETNQRLELVVPNDDQFGYAALRSVELYSLEGSYVKLEVPLDRSAGNNSYFALDIFHTDGTQFMWQIRDSTANLRALLLSPATTELYSVAYNAVTHRWLRIRETAGTIYWETSTDGEDGNWVVRASNSSAGLTLSPLRVLIEVYANDDHDAGITAYIDNYNLTSGTPAVTYVGHMAMLGVG